MTALELLTVICAFLALATAAILSVLAARTVRVARELSAASQKFTDEALPAIEELKAAARLASGEVERIDDLLEVAGSIGARVDTATEATYRALTSPLIKGVAFASGTRRAARRIRGGKNGDKFSDNGGAAGRGDRAGRRSRSGRRSRRSDNVHALPVASVETTPELRPPTSQATSDGRRQREVASGRRAALRGRTKG